MDNRTQTSEKKNKRIRNILLSCIVIAVLVLIAIIAIGLRQEGSGDGPAAEDGIVYGDEYLGIDPLVDERLQKYRNLVLFGIDKDAGDTGNSEAESAGSLSEDFLIVSFDLETEEMKMVSVYGDTYLKIDDNNYDKINNAYSAGGMDQCIRAINSNLELNIREGMALSWDTIELLVDRIGGIELAMPDGTVQAMNGEQAAAYAKTDYDILDEDRADAGRMQTVLTAALNKAKTMEADELTQILDEVMPQIVQRSMNRDKVTAVFLEMSVQNTGQGIAWPYEVQQEEGRIVPNTLESNVARLHRELFGQQQENPAGSTEAE